MLRKRDAQEIRDIIIGRGNDGVKYVPVEDGVDHLKKPVFK